MKKISRTIAMILVLVMLAGSFSSCFTVKAFNGELYGGILFILLPIYPMLDLVTLPIQLIGWAISKKAPWEWAWHGSYDGMENQIYLANAEYDPLAEYYFLSDKTGSLSEEELASLKQNLYSIPETERNASMNKLTSLSEEKRVSLVMAYNSLPEKEIISSIERINALTETERVSLMKTFNSLSEAELDFIIDKLNSFHETENVVLADNFITLPEPDIVSLKNDLQYFNMGRRLWFQ